MNIWLMLFFFFSSRRRHTRYWRDWSSDVCSSDLPAGREVEHGTTVSASAAAVYGLIGRASCRESVDLGGRRIIKKKKKKKEIITERKSRTEQDLRTRQLK